VHDAFIRGAKAFKEANNAINAIGPAAPEKLMQGILDHLERDLQEIWNRYPDLKSPTMGIFYSTSRDIRVNDLEHLHWRRHGKTHHQDVEAARRDRLDALERLNRTSTDYVRRRRGKRVKNFKNDPTHWTLLESGIDLGLDELTSEELADCFDEVCPCRSPHDADAMKKQRNRLRKLLEEAKRNGACELL
jgi:hypothetical protein